MFSHIIRCILPALQGAVRAGGIVLLVAATALAQQASNSNNSLKPLPPPGVDVPAADRAELESGLTALQSSIKRLDAIPDNHVQSLLPDVQIFAHAVDMAWKNNGFFDTADIAKAKALLKEGQARADQLLAGQSPWATATGLVVRGYISKIDGSVQPYGLVVPDSYASKGTSKVRLDVWLHGRNEKLSEVNFLEERRKNRGEFAPEDTIVLHPYGRYCNAYKFAGEIDVLEAMQAVKHQYRIDDDRTAIRGFSMGGAGCWHLAVHYADRWVAAAPGAGFAETEQYLKMSDDDIAALPDWQRKLFHLYDCPDWAANLYHCPTIAYHGEDDPQKQSAEIMEKALADEGIQLRCIVGPHTQHKYEPQSKLLIDSAVASLADVGRDRSPSEVHFTTYTLRYNHLEWVQVDGLAQHWDEGHVEAAISAGEDAEEVAVRTKNVTDLTLSFPPGWVPFDIAQPVKVTIDDQELDAPRAFSDRSWECKLHRNDQNQWKVGEREFAKDELRKRTGLQGPIDDAFMDSFLMVRPTGKTSRGLANRWVQAEMDRAIRQWRLHFRGDARVKDDTAITDDDIASNHLILWGDEQSNGLIKRINNKLPIHWQGDTIVADQKKVSAAEHVPVLIYPNPLNPEHYVVLNSGFTFREADYGTNARQVPRLPDWAILDIRTPPDATQPGKIESAGFFGEHWELNPTAAKGDKDKTAMNER